MEENIYHLNLPQEIELNFFKGNFSIKDIDKIISTLPNDYRIPFTMYVAGYSYYEISSYIDISIDDVKYRVDFAREKLQNVLAYL